MAQFQFDGKKLRQLREERGLYLKDVAAAVGCSAAAVGQWETGKRNPSTAAAKKLAEFFDVDSASLWLGLASSSQDSNSFPPPKTEGDIIRHVAALVSVGFTLKFSENEETGKSTAVMFSPDIDKKTDLWGALVSVGAIQNAVAAGFGVNVVDGSTIPADWQSILGPYLDFALAELDKIPLDKEETPAPEE